MVFGKRITNLKKSEPVIREPNLNQSFSNKCGCDKMTFKKSYYKDAIIKVTSNSEGQRSELKPAQQTIDKY